MNKESQSPKRALWSTRFAFIMVTAGAAVGMGNIWKFPYVAGQNGGGAFVLIYLLCVALIGLPVLMAEIVIGRLGRQNPITTFATLAQQFKASKLWPLVGWLGISTLILVLSFYSVVAGWSLDYLVKAATGHFNNAQSTDIQATFTNLLANPTQMIIWHTLFMVLTLFIIAKGVRQGIEQLSRYLMPCLFLILLVLVIYGMIKGEWKAALDFMFSFRFEEVTRSSIINAMGQAFFSLAAGAGAMLIYGSYLPSKTRLASNTLIIAGLDTLAAILAGLAIFPIVFAHQLSPTEGPGLMFIVLPMAFSQMGNATIIGSLFFTLLFFAAWSSSISMAEPLVAMLIERWKIKRISASIFIGTLAWSIGLISLFSFNIWDTVKVFDRWPLFEVMTDLPTNIMLPLGGLLICIFAGWILPKTIIQKEVNIENHWLFTLWLIAIRFIAPLGILAILISNLIA